MWCYRKQKQEDLERLRKEEEEQMEARRRELLSEEDGYWRRRMAQEAAQQALQEGASAKATQQVSISRPCATCLTLMASTDSMMPPSCRN